MSPARFSLQPLLEIMQTRSDEATRQLGQLIAAETNARARLDMLVNYRNEYAERLSTATLQGISPRLLQNHQDFIARIEEAVSQQQQAVLDAEKHTAQGKQRWQSANQKLKAFDTLAERHEAKLVQMENKQAQKLLDEFTTRRFASNTPEDPA